MRPRPREPIGFRLCYELEGLLLGARADGHVNSMEFDRVVRWLADAEQYRDIRPFSELIPHVDRVLADGVITLDECDDLLFVASKYTTVNPYFDSFRQGIQVLMGVIAAVSADRVLVEAETRALQGWTEEWSHLRGLWPYDECESIVVAALTNNLPRDAVEYMIALSAQFPIGGHLDPATGELPPPVITGICAVDPQIEFERKQFVFTGESERWSRDDLEYRVRNRNGIPHPRLTKDTDYLVVCDCGNPLWAFGCYGRKVEQAYNMRRQGHPIVIVREIDFADALND